MRNSHIGNHANDERRMGCHISWQSQQFINAINSLCTFDSMQVTFLRVAAFEVCRRGQWSTARHGFDRTVSQR